MNANPACCIAILFAAADGDLLRRGARGVHPPASCTATCRRSLNRLSVALALVLGSLSGYAADFDVAGGKLSVKGSVTAGAAWRTVSQDTSLVANVNSSLVGITGTSLTATTGRNQDDGNLNFNKGDPVSQVVNGYLSVEYTSGNYGGLVSAKAWYDYELADANHPWGNIPSGYTPNAPLSDEGAQARTRFSGVVLDNLYVRGKQPISELPFEWVLGWQKLDWGNRYIVIGGLRDLNPIDIPALTRPGMLQREQETRIPVPQIFARLGVTPTTAVEGFYQFHFERNAPNQCGTFYSGVDWYSDGCNAVTFGALSDRGALAAGTFLKRLPNDLASNSGQFGLAVTQTVEPWATKFGFYGTQFHSRQGYSGVTKSGRPTGAPVFVPGDPDGLNPKYFTEYPENIHMFGLTFETKTKLATAFGELTYRPNQPFQYNAADLLNAVLSPLLPTTLRAKEQALPPGGTLNGFERHKQVQLQLGTVGQIPAVLGAAGMNLGGEIVYKTVPDLPDVAVTRFGRVDVFGQGPVNGVCPAPAVPSQCSSDGYVSKHAWGYRLVWGLRYANIFDGVDMIPSLLFGQDVSGWSGDGGILEGRKLAILSLRFNHRSGLVWDVAWVPTWGGTYNNQRDRSAALTYVGYRF
jgi:hypothetical protein